MEYNNIKEKTQEVEKQVNQQQQETTVQTQVIPPANRRKQPNPTRRGNGDRGDSGVIEIE
jgi:hypothetical protein